MGSSMTQAVDLPLRNASPHYVFRAFRLLLLIGGMWLAWTSPAWANQPPGPQMLLAEVLILPLMMLLTLLGGGYAVMRALGVKRRRWLIALAVLAILLTGIQEGLGALLMLLVFGPWALVRGIRLVVWGVKAMRPPARRAAHLVHASPRRLMAAGLLTCFTAVAMVNLSLAFFNWLPPESYKVEGTFKRLVAYEVASGKTTRMRRGSRNTKRPTMMKARWTGISPLERKRCPSWILTRPFIGWTTSRWICDSARRPIPFKCGFGLCACRCFHTTTW